MRGLMKVVACAGVVVGAGGITPPVEATTYSADGFWSNGPSLGQPAGNCTVIIPDDRPLSVPQTFVVGSDIPDGTEIFSWGYGEAFSDIVVSCVSSGIGGANGDIDIYAASSVYVNGDSRGYIPLSDSGFALKLWGRFNTAPGNNYSVCGGVSVNCQYYITSYANPSFVNEPAANTEIDLTPTGASSASMSQTMRKYWISAPPSLNQLLPTYTGSFSFRMALIKVGTPQYNGPLHTSSTAAFSARATIKGTYNVYGLLDGSGITIAPPACQLRTTDYTIPMGRWAADAITYVGGPAYGSQVPVNLSLECSGKVDHVRFRFEDTGTTLSGNNNISLYDTSGGNKVDGLEIELLYNGMKANVDNTTVTDTGSHGATKVSPASLPLYDSVGTAAFQARYVQSAAVTRAGADYTGPVTGKVNMYVTYD
ncbi:TPA: type 1 fimbrial protein [Raoultella ornithinolytica]|nr:type 1 fimbrial protein [Raoultella ornithinolytica]